MKLVLLACLLSLGLTAPLSDAIDDRLTRELTSLLNHDSPAKQKAHTTRQMSPEYAALKSKYERLQSRYERLLTQYKQKGYLPADAPMHHAAALDFSALAPHRARKLRKLRAQAKRHHRRMQDHIEHHIFYADDDYTPRDSDSWLTSAVKRTANSLGIDNQSDALIAGAGAGALAYGVHSKNTAVDMKKRRALKIQKQYVMKETIAQYLTQEVKELTELVDVLGSTGRQMNQTADNICASISTQMNYMEDGY